MERTPSKLSEIVEIGAPARSEWLRSAPVAPDNSGCHTCLVVLLRSAGNCRMEHEIQCIKGSCVLISYHNLANKVFHLEIVVTMM